MIDRVPELLAEAHLAGLVEDIEFPAAKDDLLEAAEERHAPTRVLDALDRLPDKTFYSAGEVYECWQEPKEGD